MTNNRFNILVAKYLADELCIDEQKELNAIISSNKNYEQEFKELINVSFVLNFPSEDITKDAKAKFTTFLNTKSKAKRISLKKVLTYAAVVAGIFLSIFTYHNFSKISDKQMRESLVILDEKVVLVNENGTFKEMKIAKNHAIKNNDGEIEAVKKDNTIIYNDKKITSLEKVVMHTLKVPFGKKFNVTLHDGTKIFLNSGSSITYPNKFIADKNRIVTLDGEAYFEVTKNKKQPFIVKTSSLNVRVLGTEFCLSSYKTDKFNSIALVEGSVAVSKATKSQDKLSKSILLKPGKKATINNTSNEKIVTKSIADISKYTSLKRKEIIFKNDKFIDIIKTLERNFNVKIVSENANLNSKEFTGKFYKRDDVFDILSAFKIHTSFTYSVENNRIIIKK